MIDEEKLLTNSINNATLNRYSVIKYLLSLNENIEDYNEYPIFGLLHGFDFIINKKFNIFLRKKGNGFKAPINVTEEAILISGLDILSNQVEYNLTVGGKSRPQTITLAKYIAYETKSFLIAKSEFKNDGYDEMEEANKYIYLLKFNLLLNVLSFLNDVKIKQCLYQIGVKNAEEVVTSKVEPIF